MPSFLTITNEAEYHYGHQFVDGLNVLQYPFIEDETKEDYVKVGLFFFDANNINEFIGHGVWIREVILPTNDDDFKMVTYKNMQYRANKIILGKRHNIFDPETINNFSLKFSESACEIYAKTNFEYIRAIFNLGLLPDMFYKITDEKEIETISGYDRIHNIQLKPGLIVLPRQIEFDADVNSHYGFCFTTKRYLKVLGQKSNGKYIRAISLPLDDPEFIISSGSCSHEGSGVVMEYHSNKIIVGERHQIIDPDTIAKFDLKFDRLGYELTMGKSIFDSGYDGPIRFCKRIISTSSKVAELKRLEWMFDSGFGNFILNDKGYSVFRSKYGDTYDLGIIGRYDTEVKELSWWIRLMKKHNLVLEFSKDMVDLASQCNKVDVLEFWKNHRDIFKLNYTEKTLDNHGDQDTAKYDWWLNSGLELKYTEEALKNAIYFKHYNVLEWWSKNKDRIEVKYANNLLDSASLNILRWWEKSNLRMIYTEKAMEYAGYDKKPDELEFWKDYALRHNVKLKYSHSAVDGASERGRIDVIEWWKDLHTNNPGVEFLYSSDAIDKASANGHIKVLDWWVNASKKYNLELKYTSNALDETSKTKHLNVLKWWKRMSRRHNLELKYTARAIDNASSNGCYNRLVYFLNDIDEEQTTDCADNLKWWLYSGIRLEYSELSIDCLHFGDNDTNKIIKILNIWKEAGLEMKYSNLALDRLVTRNDPQILEWWKNSGLELKFSPNIVDIMSFHLATKSLEWWKNNLTFTYTTDALDKITAEEERFDGKSCSSMPGCGNGLYRQMINTFEWWKNSGFEMKYTEKLLDNAYKYELYEVCKYWHTSDLEIKHTLPYEKTKKYNDRYYMCRVKDE